MGRWGFRLFEGDMDIDEAFNISEDFAKSDKDIELARVISETDIVASPKVKEFYKTDEYRQQLNNHIVVIRQKVDTGLCDKFFAYYRTMENENLGLYDGKYRVVLFGALMMRVGAKIKQDDLDHLREIALQIKGQNGYVSPICETGFRAPGKIQFLTALDNYQAGTPRNFIEPSCFHCGRVRDDLGETLRMCSKCQRAWFCNHKCQRAEWKMHKKVCHTLEERNRLINV